MRPQGGPADTDIEVAFAGPRADVLRDPEAISAYLRGLSGVYDVQHDMEVGKLEYRYSISERGRELVSLNRRSATRSAPGSSARRRCT